MSHPSAAELAGLHVIADELIEASAERGHRVERALDVDPAFGSGRSKSSLLRDLVIEVVGQAATLKANADFRPVNGAGREIRFLIDKDRRYRVLRGRRDGSGELVVHVNSDSNLAVDDEAPGLWGFEQWVLVWLSNDDCLITGVLACEVRDVVVGSPGRLVFGEEIQLGSSGDGPHGSFVGDTRRLDEFLDDYLDEDHGDQPGEQSA